MSKLGRGYVVKILVLISILGCSTMAAVAADSPAIENREVAAALTQAQKLAAKKQWIAALAQLEKARQVKDKSPYAKYKIDEFTGYILTRQRKYRQAAAVFEELASSDHASREQAATHLKTAAQLYLQAKQNSKAADTSQRALKMQPGDAQLLQLSGEAQYLANDFKGAANTLHQLVNVTEQQGRKPKEDWLQMILNSHYKLDDRQGIEDSWEALLRHYPKSEYWRKVLELKTAGTHPDSLELGYQRLMFELGMLQSPDDYEDFAMNAIDSGLPSEAVRVLREGLERGGPLAGANEARFRRMLVYAQGAVEKRRAELAKEAQEAQSADTAQFSVELGRVYLAQGRYDEAIAALERGLEQGQLYSPDQARVDLGIAYLKKDELDRARRTFARVERDSEWHDLAELWNLRAMNAMTARATTGR